MNKFIKFTLVLCSFFVYGKFYAQTFVYPEAEKVDTFSCSLLFPLNGATFDPKFENNAEMISRIDSIIRYCQEKHIIYYFNIDAFSSVEGHSDKNVEFSEKRALSVENYLLQTLPNPVPLWFHAEGFGANWEEFRNVVSLDGAIPAQQQILDIIDDNRLGSNEKETKIRLLAKGETYNYLKKNIFPSMRKVDILLKYGAKENGIFAQSEPALLPDSVPELVPDSVPELVSAIEPEVIGKTENEEIIDTIAPQVISESPPALPQLERPGRWAVKTNLLYWAVAGIFNAGVEYTVGQQWSIDFPITYSPYTISNNWRMRTLSIQPEVRWWTAQTKKGHFFGLHGHVAYYNISVNGLDRYQDKDGKTPLWGFGVSYGYAFHLKNHWNMEAVIGAGYARLNYDIFYNVSNGARYANNIKNYWGITQAAVNLIYQFNERKR